MIKNNRDKNVFWVTPLTTGHTRKRTYVAYLDAEKAFDKINTILFMYKFRGIGVSGLLYEAIHCIYESSNSYV